MAISASLAPDIDTPAHGATVIFTYTVTGNDPIPASAAAIAGAVTIAGVVYDVTTAVTLPGTPAGAVAYDPPSGGGLVFNPTADPAVFTALIP